MEPSKRKKCAFLSPEYFHSCGVIVKSCPQISVSIMKKQPSILIISFAIEGMVDI